MRKNLRRSAPDSSLAASWLAAMVWLCAIGGTATLLGMLTTVTELTPYYISGQVQSFDLEMRLEALAILNRLTRRLVEDRGDGIPPHFRRPDSLERQIIAGRVCDPLLEFHLPRWS